jgi:hypothetical protein
MVFQSLTVENSMTCRWRLFEEPGVGRSYGTARKNSLWRFRTGIGGYFLELAARTERGALIEKFVKKQSFGGYVSVGIDLPIRIGGFGLLLRLEDKLHWADFGNLGNFSPGSGGLTGPINTIHIGFGLVL